MKREIVELNLTLLSKKETKTKPAYSFVGGIEVELKDGRKYCLDFNETKWVSYAKVKKKCEMYVCQKYLNEDYIKESTEDNLTIEQMTDLQFLIDNAKSLAVYVEVEGKNETEFESEFEVVAFDLRGMDEEKGHDFTSISTLQ